MRSYFNLVTKNAVFMRSVAFCKRLLEYIRREVAHMTAYEIITIFIGILALLMSCGSLIIAFLTFLDKRNNKKK